MRSSFSMRSVPTEASRALDALAESDDVAAIDLALARLLAEADPERAVEVALAAALVSALQRAGHSAVALADWGGEEFPGTALRLPGVDAWHAALAASPVVGTPDASDVQPLVLDDGRLSLYRLWAAERRVAQALASRLGAQAIDADALRETLAALFPDAAGGERQALAAAGALRHRLAVVAGGPGTGKTTTVVKLLALLLTADPDLEIALATPTGKAADRLAGSIASRVADLPIPDAVRDRIPTEAVTLHRLLGYSPSRRAFMRTPAAPLSADVVVIDETSMADLLLMDALLAALKPGARLVLLGDADQLPSVGAGAVFGDVCAAGAGETVSPDFGAVCAALGVGGVETGEGSPLGDAVVRLTVSHRFPAGSGIGTLAAALRTGTARGVREALAPGAFPDVVCQNPPDRAEAIWAAVEPHARRLCEATDPHAALDAVGALRLLAPTRGGRWGVGALNRLVERRLSESGLRGSARSPWYAGRPVLVTANDYDRGLFNGDVGVVWAPDGRRPVVLFPDADGFREVPIGGLPEHETAWAMTVHKSQGSEFDRVILVTPAPGSREAERLTRALAYTAVTRAKAQAEGAPPPLVVLGSPEALVEAARREDRRASGLADRLASAARARV